MVGIRESAAFHRNTALDGHELTVQEREELLRQYLPPSPSTRSPSPSQGLASPTRSSPSPSREAGYTRRKAMAKHKTPSNFFTHMLHMLIYFLMHTLFSLYIRFRQAYHAVFDRLSTIFHYHHHNPELIKRDICHLDRIPKHVSVVLEYKKEEGGLEALVNDVCEIAAWCICAEVPMLSIYEKTGILKKRIPQTHRAIKKHLATYFKPDNRPHVSIGCSHGQAYTPPEAVVPNGDSVVSRPQASLQLLLVSENDGRKAIVDLTKTLAEMAQKGKLAPADISQNLIDSEMTEAIMPEPDLLVLFGPSVVLKGYPPWQLRLTEIFHSADSQGVDYQVFLRALHRYGKAQMRFGR